MNNTICLAIHNRNILSVYYRGGYRTIEPFCYGINDNTGNELLRAYQIEGYSKSHQEVGWKIMIVKELKDINILNETFNKIREHYNPKDLAMHRHYCFVPKD
jgi:hypothetical protein